MAQSGTVTSESAADYGKIVAPDSLALAFGSGFASAFLAGTATLQNSMYVLPTTIGGTTVTITDSSKAALNPALYMVSPEQINFVVPSATALGAGTISVNSASGSAQGPLLVSNVAPGILTADATGNGVAAAMVMTVNAAGQSTTTSTVQPETPVSAANPIVLGGGNIVYLELFGTGIRHHSLNPVIALIGGVQAPVTYAGPQNQYPGLDMVTIGPLPSTLAGAGLVNVMVIVDGVPANTVQVAFQ
jgi:uncharacterized protein (TIGR03437 family)